MLLKLYYLYDKLPKKCRELYEFPEGGNLPIQAHGTRWISNKRNALWRVVDKFGAYISHLASLTKDKSIKSVDRQGIF